MNRTAMPDGEVKSRLDAIERYNNYFAVELDKDGNPLTQHIVTAKHIAGFMRREWNVEPAKYGIIETDVKPKADQPSQNLSNAL